MAYKKRLSKGTKILIVRCKENPQYEGREGIVRVRDGRKLYGSWGASSIRDTDSYEIIEK